MGLSLQTLWLRGGFPESLLAGDDTASLDWRRDFIRSYLERDVPMFAPRLPAETLRRLWVMLAHQQGSVLNQARLAAALGVSEPTVGRYIDLLVDLQLVRRLMPWSSNVGKRLVKSPKVLVRDSGLVHALLEIETLDELLGHPVSGHSFEGLCIDNLVTGGRAAPASLLLPHAPGRRDRSGVRARWCAADRGRGQAVDGPQPGAGVCRGL